MLMRNSFWLYSQSDQAITDRIPVVRTRDIKDRMIQEQQERQERTRDAVDDIEAYVEGKCW